MTTNQDEVREDKYICQADHSTTRIARATECCGGYHQTIAGALLKSKYWKEWYDHASKNMLFDVDETLTVDAMSDEHFESFMKFCLGTLLAKKREAVVGLKRKFSQPHDILQNGCGGSDANCDVHPRIEVGDVLDEVLSTLS